MKGERNRTLTISDDERNALKEDITTLDQISSGFIFDNRTVQANLFDVLPLMPDAYADLVIIDPPYNLTKDFNGSRFMAMSTNHYEEYLRSWFGLVCQKLKTTGSLYICGDWKSTAALQRVIEEYGLTILNRITWQREKGRGAKANWKNSMEDIWFAVKDPKNYYFDVEAVMMKRKVFAPYRVDGVAKDWQETEDGNFRITYPSNFWDDISVPFWSMPENTDHPTQKPEKLVAKLILASSRPGDVVLDPFLGSGTTSVVAKKLGRIYCGVEQNEEYCLYTAKRLKNVERDCHIQGYSDGVFWERNTLREQMNTRK
ncbi:MAG: site-specific DNA-methyltransferase [Muribaculaceae bacterium]|nr:site-specific DNA-methyltransferase [Muribaculaceae bacterium]